MFGNEWKYKIFDRYTLIEEVINEYKDSIKINYATNNIENNKNKKKWLNNNKKNLLEALVYFVVSFIIFFSLSKVIIMCINDIEWIKKVEIIKEVLYVFLLILQILFIIIIFPKAIFIIIKEQKFSINREYMNYFCKGIKIFFKILKNNWKNLGGFIIVFLVFIFIFFKVVPNEDKKNLQIIHYYILSWILGTVILYMLNRKYSKENRDIILFWYAVGSGLVALTEFFSLLFLIYSKRYIFLNSLNILISTILLLLIIERFITNLKDYKDKRNRYKKIKINKLKRIFKKKNIDINKFNELVSNRINEIEKYYNLINGFNFVLKSLLTWGGISVIIERIKHSNIEDINKLWNNIINNKFDDKTINGITIIVYIIVCIIFLWLVWEAIFFVFKQVIEAKYMSKEDLFEFRDLLQDIILEKDSSSIID